MVIALAAAALIAIGVFAASHRAFRSNAISTVAVLPFENATGDPANEYLCDGISESLINKLERPARRLGYRGTPRDRPLTGKQCRNSDEIRLPNHGQDFLTSVMKRATRGSYVREHRP